MNTLTSNDSVLNTVLSLKHAETKIMEARCLGEYYGRTIDDEQVMESCISDISSIVSSVASGVSKLGSSLCKELSTYLTNFSKFADKHKKFFKDLPESAVHFKFEGYRFTTLDAGRVNLSEFQNINAGYIDFVKNMRHVTTDTGVEAIKDQLSRYMWENNLARIRGEMLGCNRPIDEQDFVTDVKKYYRSGTLDKRPMDINKHDIMDILNVIDPIQKELKLTQKDFDNVNDMFRRASAFIYMQIQSLESGKTKNVGSNEVLVVGQDNAAEYIAILNAKYSQISFLTQTAQVILGERVTALKDQIEQNMNILKFCLADAARRMAEEAGGSKQPLTLSVDDKLHSTYVGEATDYTEIVLEQLIFQETQFAEIMENRYAEEIDFVTTCIESRSIVLGVMEAGSLKNGMSGLKGKVIEFIDKIIGAIRSKIMDYNKSYIPWVNDLDQAAVVSAAEKMSSITLAPYYKVNTNTVYADFTRIGNGITKASTNTKYDDMSFTKDFVDNVKTLDDYEGIRGDLPGYLKNYFRFHERNEASVKKAEISGKELAKKIPDMIQYILRYKQLEKSLTDVRKKMETALKNMGTDTVMDSAQYLQIEDLPTYQTLLGCLEGYQVLMEQDDAPKSGTVVNEDGEKESPTSVETSDQKEEAAAKETGKQAGTSAKYQNMFNHFFQLVISAAVTATEERFISYINVLGTVSGGKPKLDKNGKYVPKESTKKENVAESVVPQMSEVRSKPSEMYGLSMYK